MRWKTLVAVSITIGVMPAACGARTGLRSELGDENVAPPFDAARDRSRTRPESGLPPIDGALPDADKTGCTDASISSALVVTETANVMRFSPTSGFSSLSNIDCGAPSALRPESMAIRRDGHALVMYAPYGIGSKTATALYDVDIVVSACKRTPFAAAVDERFGMGFTTIGVGPDEELFVVDTKNVLSKVTQSFQRIEIGVVTNLGELAGGGDGRLFHFYSPVDAPGSRLAELDKTTGAEIAADPLFDVAITSAWAMARFGTDFYLFTTSATGGTDVTRYNLTTKLVTRKVFSSDEVIVGAGASTCASP